MSKPKCPKCKTYPIKFFTHEINPKINLQIKTPHWKCMICGWVGFETNIICPRCKKTKAIRGKGSLYCTKCNCFLLTDVNIKNKELSVCKEENVLKVNLSCPKCSNNIITGFTKISKKPIWCCRYWQCNWKALKTNVYCKRCGNFLSFVDNQFYCPYCKKPLFDIKDLQEIQEEMKYFQEELK